jgi:hypothetical protein
VCLHQPLAYILGSDAIEQLVQTVVEQALHPVLVA